MSTPKILADYAKSGRSSCKKCSRAIAASSLRLGVVNKDPRGFDATKWHHLSCFPPRNFSSMPSAEAITGFSSLKSNDQDSIRMLLEEGAQDSDKVSKADGKEDNETQQGKYKKQKLSAPEEQGRQDLAAPVCASDIKDKYKDASLPPNWKAFQTIIFLAKDEDLRGSNKIAAFDFDGCLANTSVRRTGADAWSLMYPSIPEKLQCLYNDGFKLVCPHLEYNIILTASVFISQLSSTSNHTWIHVKVIFTNESNIERWKNKRQAAVDSKIGRLESFIKLVNVPMQVFIACGLSSAHPEDRYRKPKTGMWKLMEELNSGLSIDMDKSFYVGDAAGRAGDHSDADLKFAEAIGLKFYVPEEYFTLSS